MTKIECYILAACFYILCNLMPFFLMVYSDGK
jgi:hypothetical protein